jgi:hypothetical protein
VHTLECFGSGAAQPAELGRPVRPVQHATRASMHCPLVESFAESSHLSATPRVQPRIDGSHWCTLRVDAEQAVPERGSPYSANRRRLLFEDLVDDAAHLFEQRVRVKLCATVGGYMRRVANARGAPTNRPPGGVIQTGAT